MHSSGTIHSAFLKRLHMNLKHFQEEKGFTNSNDIRNHMLGNSTTHEISNQDPMTHTMNIFTLQPQKKFPRLQLVQKPHCKEPMMTMSTVRNIARHNTWAKSVFEM